MPVHVYNCLGSYCVENYMHSWYSRLNSCKISQTRGQAKQRHNFSDICSLALTHASTGKLVVENVEQERKLFPSDRQIANSMHNYLATCPIMILCGFSESEGRPAAERWMLCVEPFVGALAGRTPQCPL